jgi:hypothetical protein
MRGRRRAHASPLRIQDQMEPGTTHTLSRLFPGGCIVFASIVSRPGAKAVLVHRLLRELARHDPAWSAPPDGKALTLCKSTLGSPYLLLEGKQGPALSFSHGGGRLWAAVCGRGSVGIDVAYREEFGGDYPFARAFRPEELDCARALFPDDKARGAALIWSLKEASVKATGSGFNLFDPLEVYVGKPLFREDGFLFEVLAGRPISAVVRQEHRGWLSMAWV